MTLQIKTGKRGTLPERLIIIGEKKIGKTTFGADSEAPIFIPTEDGCSGIDGLAYFDKQSSYKDVLERVVELGKEDHKYKTLVIDTLDGVVELCSNQVMKDSFDNNPFKFNNYLQGNKVVAQEMKLLLDYLDRIREKKKMRIILLCHTGTANQKNPEGDDYIKSTGYMGKYTWGLFANWADRIGHAGYDFKVRSGDDSENKKGKIIQRDDNRYLRFGGTATLDVGCRIGYEMKEDKILFTYADYKKNSLIERKQNATV